VPALPTIETGTLSVASALPDPPFEVVTNGAVTGFDAELMQAICTQLDVRWKLVRYRGDDFDGIFAGLKARHYDAVASGTTITPWREHRARFSSPYLESGQSLVVNRTRTPHIRSIDDLAGQVVGIQEGNTSEIVAKELKAKGALGEIKYYPYRGILDALADLSAGRIGAFMKLFPVTTWLVRDRPELAVVQEIPTHDRLGIAVALDNAPLCTAIDAALHELRKDGTVATLQKKWLE
jgi:polar amino acid transport system substrate-binding protein